MVWRTVARAQVASDTAVWYCSGLPPAPIRWVLVRDSSGESEPQAFLRTDLAATPERILGWFVSRWRMETTFQEVRAHLGVETQRQWSDLAILRTTPALLGLFSLVAVWADELARAPTGAVRPRIAARYDKREPTFSDAIAAVHRALWHPPGLSMSRSGTGTVEISAALLQRLTDTLCHAACNAESRAELGPALAAMDGHEAAGTGREQGLTYAGKKSGPGRSGRRTEGTITSAGKPELAAE